MATVKTFRCVRPRPDLVREVAALPYDVYSRAEAKEAVQGHPLSFLNIDRPETQFGPEFDMYSDEAYQKAREMLDREIADGTFVTEEKPSFYVYEQSVKGGSLEDVLKGHVQTGIVALASVDDYLNQVIKKHENTREEKEQDRIRHVDCCNAQTGPIFLAYRNRQELTEITEKVKEEEPLYNFMTEDGIGHRVWRVDREEVTSEIGRLFQEIPALYIADGHHRAASAVKVAEMRRRGDPGWTGEEEFNYFLAVLFPDTELEILPYNRFVRDLNGLSAEDLLLEADAHFRLRDFGDQPVIPDAKGIIGMYLGGHWYEMIADADVMSEDPVDGLDVSILQDTMLQRVLGIDDPRTDRRISFIGGIRGTKELETLVDQADSEGAGPGSSVAFSMYPTQMEELFRVADAGLLMPPKSTWFEPKLRSGIFIHRLG